MRSVHTSYGQYFNKKYNRVGPLFQGRFKQAVLNDNNFIYLSAYVNANAQIHGIIDKAEEHRWCSYPDYLGLRNGTLCNKARILDQFKDILEYRGFVEENVKEFKIKKEADKFILED